MVAASAPLAHPNCAHFLASQLAQHAVQQAANESVAAPNAIKHTNFAWLQDVPIIAHAQRIAPQLCAFTLITSRRVVANNVVSGYCCLTRLIISLKLSILATISLPPASGPRMPKAQLKILLVTDQNVRQAGDFFERGRQLRLATFPERSPMIQVERDPRTMFLGRPERLPSRTDLLPPTMRRSNPTYERSERPLHQRCDPSQSL